METKSLGGSSYFLLLKDDYSSYRYVYFLKNKYETKEKIVEFFQQFENEFECKVKRFRSDGGGEFKNRELEEIFKRKRIVHEVTVAYTPEQNGRIEREIRTIVESARTMIINANVGKELWAEAVYNAVYTINRTGSSSRKGKTPYELLYKKKYNISLLRTFGTEVSVHIPKQRRLKWDPKEKIGRFVGYGTSTKGYRVWFEKEKEVETYRDVIFMEHSRNYKEEICGTNKEKVTEVKNEVGEGQDEVVEDENKITEDEEEVLKVRDDLSEEDHGRIEHAEDITEEVDKIQENKEVREEDVDNESERSRNSTTRDNNFEEEYLEEEWLSADEARLEEGKSERERGKRIMKNPTWMKDYEVGLIAQGEEKLSYKEAVEGKDKRKWKEAINKELEALEKNKTWIETELPKGKKAIDSKWVFKIKKDEDTEIFKARLVARGFKQEDKLDHAEIYAPVAKLPTLRILLAIANKFDLELHQMDVKNAFLNGDIDEEVYLEKPEGMKKDGKVLKLKKSLYGLKKSPRYWNESFDRVMKQEGFIRSKCDYCLYYKQDVKFYVLLYVDDIILIADDKKKIEELKMTLKQNFEMK
ncbi:hypothetical protein O0L34_g17825 [Tuta absoluta]|nr:hypothetical protein O0L34_g17825 [Tuta absoluta]